MALIIAPNWMSRLNMLKTLIIYKSISPKKNTEKVAKAMAEVMGAQLMQPEEVDIALLAGYGLIGFGSGIYGHDHHKEIRALVDKTPANNKDAFVFSTSQFTGGWLGGHKGAYLVDTLKKKGWNVKGVFWCGGETRVLFNVRYKDHPDAKDLEDARIFAKSLMN
jgi:flavodoxin